MPKGWASNGIRVWANPKDKRFSLWLQTKVKALHHQLKAGNANKAAAHAAEIYHQLSVRERLGLENISELGAKTA